MLEIFKYCGNIIKAVIQQWQQIEIGGFRPFWYLVGLGLLTIFGSFLRGLLASEVVGGIISKLGSKNQKKGNGSKITIINISKNNKSSNKK